MMGMTYIRDGCIGSGEYFRDFFSEIQCRIQLNCTIQVILYFLHYSKSCPQFKKIGKILWVTHLLWSMIYSTFLSCRT